MDGNTKQWYLYAKKVKINPKCNKFITSIKTKDGECIEIWKVHNDFLYGYYKNNA